MSRDALLSAVSAGSSLEGARAAVVLLHGRGGTARDLLSLADALAQPGLAWLLPQAPGNTWYPFSFLAPLADNEPALSDSLALLGEAVAGLGQRGMARDRVVIMGFSQGGCLALEYAARNPRRYGAVVGLSAGLIGPPETPRNDTGSLAGTPVYIGCGGHDPHIPVWRVRESADAMRRLGGTVTERIIPGLGHTVTDHEIAEVAALLAVVGPAGEA